MVPSVRTPVENGPLDGSPDAKRLIFARAFVRIDPLALGVAVGTVAGVGLWIATAVLVLRGGINVGYHLARLSFYLPGYSVTWPGAFLSLLEGALVGFLLGALLAFLWNAYHRMFIGLAIARETRRELQEL